uniref:Variant surface glycoprotein 1125.5517 n=1 Tax=Trypanosoma brucei TaxID=5691 RepID=A0A1J0RCN5_9TRYP|nr:variant surface glycoprotein 1125.5517 [Trypanosoma brucei]
MAPKGGSLRTDPAATSHNKRTHFLLLAAVAIAATPIGVKVADPDNGQNRQIFRLLCAAVNAAEESEPAPTLDQTAQETAALGKAIELYLKEPAALDWMIARGDAEKIKEVTDQTAPLKCRDAQLRQCKAAATTLVNLDNHLRQAVKAAAATIPALKSEINRTALEIKNVQNKRETAMRAHNGGESSKSKLTAAVYKTTANKAEPKLNGGTGKREAACGTAQTTPGTAALNSISDTLACLCSSKDGENNNKACNKDGMPQQDNWQAKKQIKAWAKIKSECASATPKVAGTTT